MALVPTRTLIVLALSAAGMVRQAATASREARSEIEVWRSFIAALEAGELSREDVRPYPELEPYRDSLLAFLGSLRAKASRTEWEALPEIHRVGENVHFLLPLRFDGKSTTFCFTFLWNGGRWYFRHLESITLRLDAISSLPTSHFPDLPEAQIRWMREENAWSERLRFFKYLASEKGRSFAFDFFRDGKGYFLQARAWVPFVEPARAFVLYLCWERAKLEGDEVTLEQLDDRRVLVRLKPIYLALYGQTTHFRTLISEADYRRLFATLWEDRARAAGWSVALSYDGDECVLRFRRLSPAP